MTIMFENREYKDVQDLIDWQTYYSGEASEEALTLPALKEILKHYALVPREPNDDIRQAMEKTAESTNPSLDIEQAQDEAYREMVKVGEINIKI